MAAREVAGWLVSFGVHYCRCLIRVCTLARYDRLSEFRSRWFFCAGVRGCGWRSESRMSWIYEGFLLGFGVAQWGRESRGAAGAEPLCMHPYMCGWS